MRTLLQEGFSLRVGCSTKCALCRFCENFFLTNPPVNPVARCDLIELLAAAVSSCFNSVCFDPVVVCCLVCGLVFSCSLLAFSAFEFKLTQAARCVQGTEQWCQQTLHQRLSTVAHMTRHLGQKPVRKAVCHFSKELSREDETNIKRCSDLIKFGMQSTPSSFVDKGHVCDGDRDPEEKGLAIG